MPLRIGVGRGLGHWNRRTQANDGGGGSAPDPTPVVLFDNGGVFLPSATSHACALTAGAQAGWVVVAWIITGSNAGVSSVAGGSGAWIAGIKNTQPSTNIASVSQAAVLPGDWNAGSVFTFNTSVSTGPGVVIVAYPSGVALDVNPAGAAGTGATIAQTLSGMASQPQYASAMYSTGSNIATFGTPPTWALRASVIAGAFGFRVFDKNLTSTSNDTTFSVAGTSANWTASYRSLTSSV